MKVFSLSNRFYYREFPDLKNIILHDLRVYNRVLHKAYKCLYDRAYKGASFKDSELHQLLKKQFHLSDYIPLSATHEAKALRFREKQKKEMKRCQWNHDARKAGGYADRELLICI